MKKSSVTIQNRAGLKSWLRNRWKTRRAETLIEVVMAIFVVATGSAAATSLIVTAVQSNSFSRDNLVALNLAVEGVEAMRNIRDTNWLKFGFDKENCWNMDPQKDTCADADLIKAVKYRLDLDVTKMRWLLTAPDPNTPLDLTDTSGVDTSDKAYQLKYMDLNTAADSDGDGNTSNDHDLYTSGIPAPAEDAPEKIVGDSPFYRMVTVEYSGAGGPSGSDEMVVTSVVQWRAQNHANKVEIKTKLTNYQKVKVT